MKTLSKDYKNTKCIRNTLINSIKNKVIDSLNWMKSKETTGWRRKALMIN
jgi:hypothetical protein